MICGEVAAAGEEGGRAVGCQVVIVVPVLSLSLPLDAQTMTPGLQRDAPQAGWGLAAFLYSPARMVNKG